jgi:DNA-directed RNA polymerase subunit RPC12/RpoP
MTSKKRTKIETRKCPNCGAELEVREDLAHGIIRCPNCRSSVNTFIEEPNEEEREYDTVSGRLKKEKIKYAKGGSFSKRMPFLPTTRFEKIPREIEQVKLPTTASCGASNDV